MWKNMDLLIETHEIFVLMSSTVVQMETDVLLMKTLDGDSVIDAKQESEGRIEFARIEARTQK